MGKGNVDIQPEKEKSCLKEGRIVLWKTNGARFEGEFSPVFLFISK